MTLSDRGLTVLGAGPVGLIAALHAARSGRSVVIVAKHLPRPDDPRRVDAVPAAFCALLVELGIHPKRVGTDRLHRTRMSAWESDVPLGSEGSKTAHVERPALDLALLDAALKAGCTVIEGAHDQRRSGRVIDATGRAAITARSRTRPRQPWIARTFWADRSMCPAAATDFSIAALPAGYVYRLGAASLLTLGVVGRDTAVSGAPEEIAGRLRAAAPWILDELPDLTCMIAGDARPASVQWTDGGSGLRIGDAALARDSLSSQGIATGASEALAAVTADDARGLELIRARQIEQRRLHLRSLLDVMHRSRFAHTATWQDYRAFIASEIDSRPDAGRVALRDGRMELVS